MSKSIFFTEKSQIVPLQPSCWHICSLGPCFETSIDKNIYRYCNDCYDLLWHIVWWVFFRELIFNWICSIRYRHSGNLIHCSNKNSKKEDDFIYSIWKTVSNIRVTHFLFYVVDDQEFEKIGNVGRLLFCGWLKVYNELRRACSQHFGLFLKFWQRKQLTPCTHYWGTALDGACSWKFTRY